jgi:hypothetical protein
MQLKSRLAIAAKGSVLWVLLALALGILPALVQPNEITLAVPWVAAGMGILGAIAHSAVSLIKPNLEHAATTTAAVAVIAIALVLGFSYWILGTPRQGLPSTVASDYELALLFVVGPMALLSWVVHRLVGLRGAA